jgi:hypothetical protein
MIGLLTPAENNLVRALAEVWDRYIELPVEHPMDRGEFARIIHDAQARVLMRPARRLLNHE